MIRDISLKYLLVLALVVTGLLPVAITALASYSTMQTVLKEQAFSQLESVLNIKKSILEEHFRQHGQNYSIEFIDLVMNERSAMGVTGETYLVGSDLRMKSDSYLDPQNHSVKVSQTGTIEKNGADTLAVRRALSGISGRDIITDYRHRQVLSAYSPVKVDEKTVFAVMAEIDEKEIDDRIAASLNSRMILIMLISVLFMIASAVIFSRIFNRNIAQIITELGDLLDNVLRGNFSKRASEFKVGSDFREVVHHMNDLVDAYSINSTEKKRLEEAVEYNQRLEAIGTLAGGIAHDFNNIISYMHAYAELALNESDNEKVSAHINEMIKGMDRAAKLISQILTFSRQKEKVPEIMDVSSFVRETVKVLGEILPKNISVKCSAQKNINILADPVSVHQILMNLCTNSFHAMQEKGGTLSVGLHAVPDDPAFCILSVSDNGTGMTEEIRKKMFEPFFTTKPRGKGTGMGLAVVHGAVKDIGGEIAVTSEPGRGTAIEIKIPVAKKETEKQDECRPEMICQGTGFVCIIDDEADIVRSMTISLENMGYHVEGYTKTSAFLETLTDDPARYDLVITDFNMPEMNGSELAQAIKNLNPEQKILLITGYADLIPQNELEKAGLSAILPKPFSSCELSEKIRNILSVNPI